MNIKNLIESSNFKTVLAVYWINNYLFIKKKILKYAIQCYRAIGESMDISEMKFPDVNIWLNFKKELLENCLRFNYKCDTYEINNYGKIVITCNYVDYYEGYDSDYTMDSYDKNYKKYLSWKDKFV